MTKCEVCGKDVEEKTYWEQENEKYECVKCGKVICGAHAYLINPLAFNGPVECSDCWKARKEQQHASTNV